MAKIVTPKPWDSDGPCGEIPSGLEGVCYGCCRFVSESGDLDWGKPDSIQYVVKCPRCGSPVGVGTKNPYYPDYPDL